MTSDKKTLKRPKGADAAERVIGVDNSFAQVDTGPIRLTSFSEDSNGPPALPCSRNDALVDEGAAAPKPCLSPVEMRTPTAAGLLPAGTASTAMWTIISRQLPFWILGETKKRTSWINNQLAPAGLRIIQTKSRQTLVFTPGGSTGRLRACPYMGTWCALLCGELFDRAPNGTRGWSVFSRCMARNIIFRKRYKRIVYTMRIADDRCFSAATLF